MLLQLHFCGELDVQITDLGCESIYDFLIDWNLPLPNGGDEFDWFWFIPESAMCMFSQEQLKKLENLSNQSWIWRRKWTKPFSPVNQKNEGDVICQLYIDFYK